MERAPLQRRWLLLGLILKLTCFFMKNGEYVFDSAKLSEAHRWCQDSVRSHLAMGLDAWVSNTFTQVKEILPYIQIANDLKVPYTILTMNGNFGSIHGVPEDAMNRMKNRFVHDLSDIFSV